MKINCSSSRPFRSSAEKELNYEYVRWMDENVDFPPDELWQKFVDMGVFSAPVPEEYGGQGLGIIDNLIISEQFCKASPSIALAIGVTTSFGVRFINELRDTGTEKKISASHRRGQVQNLHGTDRTGGRNGYPGFPLYLRRRQRRPLGDQRPENFHHRCACGRFT